MRLSRSRRGRSTRRPQVWHLTPISAPSRTTLQSSPPHGCGFLSRTTSPTANGIGSDFTIGRVSTELCTGALGSCRLHQSRDAKSAGYSTHFFLGECVGAIHRVLNGHGDQVLE